MARQYKKVLLVDLDPQANLTMCTACPLGMLTIKALNASTSVLIPVQVEFLSAKGLELLTQTIMTAKISNTVSSFKVTYKKVQEFFPKTVTPKEFEETILEALAYYFEHQQDIEIDR